jgi:hypothetical protein
MTLLIIHDASQDVLAQYDEVITRLDETGLGHPPGRMSHVAARKGDGYLVVDVWESQASFDSFGEKLVPMIVEAGGTPVPPEVHPVHNMITET